MLEWTKAYLLLKGTEITIPQCIYEYDPLETGRDFQSWNATGETENRTVMPGETFVVMEDTTFTGQWLAEGETSVDIAWQDMNDEDGLRVDSLYLQVYPDEDPEHMYTQTVTAAEGWRAVLAGDVQKVVPVWERVDAGTEGGEDTAEGYRYEMADAANVRMDEDGEEVALMGSGLTVKLIHTPGGTVTATGTITWDDDDNRDGLRVDSVTLRLFKGEEELDSQTVTSENGWAYDFGELPFYEDGRKVEYTLTEDEGTAYIDRGDDAEEATEPAEEAETAEEEAEAGWAFSFYGVPVNMNGQAVEYTIVQDEIEKYDYTIEHSNGTWITNFLLPENVTVSFDANGAEGEMESVEIAPQSEYAVPEYGFTAPEGMEFAGWTLTVEASEIEETEAEVEAETESEAVDAQAMNAGDAIFVSGNATVIAQWRSTEPVEEAANRVTVTLAVVNGAWNDGTREPVTVVLSGDTVVNAMWVEAGDEGALEYGEEEVVYGDDSAQDATTEEDNGLDV